MAYCRKCGSELDLNSEFCSACGNPVASNAPPAPGPQQPEAPPPVAYAQPGGYPPPPSKGKGGKIALVSILVLLLIAAAVVLVLGFAVGPKWFVSSDNGSGASGPEKTVNTLLKAMENKDVSGFLSTISPTSKKDLENSIGGFSLESIIGDYVFNYQSMKFSGVKLDTQIDGDNATVTVTKGTVTIVDENGDKTMEDIQDSPEVAKFVLTKENGSWYIVWDQTFE
jgi:hypothetical protein